MSAQFKVGEIATLQNFVDWHEYNETECTVIRGGATYPWYWETTLEYGVSFGYVIRADIDGDEFFVAPHQLRKKRPAQSTDEWAESKVGELTRPVERPEGVEA